MLSLTTGYAIQALSCLHLHSWVLAKDIAACTGIPPAYLSKILNSLSNSGFIHAKRGYRGGFALARSAKTITLADIARAVEGDTWLPTCLLGQGQCSGSVPCLAHQTCLDIRQKMEKALEEITLDSFAVHQLKTGRMQLDACGGACGAPDPNQRGTHACCCAPKKQVRTSRGKKR